MAASNSNVLAASNDFRAATNQTGQISDEARHIMVICFSLLAVVGFILNLFIVIYIGVKKMWKNFVSSHFIAHCGLTNMLACAYLIPIFVNNLLTNRNLYESYGGLCMFHGFLTTAIYSVVYYMNTCIAGVHLLTFARIHYDQLFGLPPSVCCLLSWVIGFALGLPCLTNNDIIDYSPNFFSCQFQLTPSGYKFLAYLLLLGVCLPVVMTLYAYTRILGIFYHSPVVFQALGLYKSRFLVYGFLILPLCQMPYFVLRFVHTADPLLYPMSVFCGYLMCIIGPIPYGLSLFMMKEEDMALTARSHKATYAAPGALPPQDL